MAEAMRAQAHLRRGERRRGIAVRRLMIQGSGGAKAKGPGGHSLPGQLGHGLDVGSGGGLAPRAPFPMT